jgi:hypothetical protein
MYLYELLQILPIELIQLVIQFNPLIDTKNLEFIHVDGEYYLNAYRLYQLKCDQISLPIKNHIYNCIEGGYLKQIQFLCVHFDMRFYVPQLYIHSLNYEQIEILNWVSESYDLKSIKLPYGFFKSLCCWNSIKSIQFIFSHEIYVSNEGLLDGFHGSIKETNSQICKLIIDNITYSDYNVNFMLEKCINNLEVLRYLHNKIQFKITYKLIARVSKNNTLITNFLFSRMMLKDCFDPIINMEIVKYPKKILSVLEMIISGLKYLVLLLVL